MTENVLAKAYNVFLDGFAEGLMKSAEPWFILTDYVPRRVGNITHWIGRTLYGRGMLIRDRNEDWTTIDARFAEEREREG